MASRPISVTIKGEYSDKDVKRAIRDLQSLQKEGPKTAKAFDGLSGKMKLWGAAAAAAVGGLAIKMGVDAVKAGSDLQESMSKVNVVFGDSASAVKAWSQTSATSFGLTQQAALEAAGTYGNLFQAFGLGQQQAQEMSTTLVQLAADLASFNNTSVDEAIQALRSGLSGETEPLKRFGIAINDVRLREEAKNLAIYNGVGVLSAAQKAQASYSLILKDTSLAQGDFARTSDGAANQMRILSASLQNLQTSFGAGFLDGFTSLSDTGKELTRTMDDMRPAIEAAGKAAGEAADGFARLAAGAGAALSELNKPMAEQSFWAKALSYTWHILSTDLTQLGMETVQGTKLTDLQSDALQETGVTSNRVTTALKQQWDAQRAANAATQDGARESATATGELVKQVRAIDKLKAALDKLSGKTSLKRQRLDLQQLLAEGPAKSGERTVMRGGKEVTERFATKADRKRFALDVADARLGIADTIVNQQGVTEESKAAARRQLTLGRKNLAGLNLGNYTAGLFSVPEELKPGSTQQRLVAGMTGQSATTINYNFAGDIVVQRAEQAVQEAKRLARLQALTGGRNAGARRALDAA